ncbi:MAG: hypothetical protein V3S16_03280 [Candidatus Desulfatibia sp.]|uniref:hypothetical protein n=1 Tax=Candidatus Desulfatibia sp. TaxID=3101189 RepID=UPI002F32BC81
MDKNPHPVHNNGSRNLFCPYYGDCLDHAAKLHRGEFKFCPYCGGRLQAGSKGPQKRSDCEACQQVHYRKPMVGVAVVLLKNHELLLVKRQGSYRGMWRLPCRNGVSHGSFSMRTIKIYI